MSTIGPRMDISVPEQFNMTTYFLEENLTAGRGDKVAVYYQNDTYTFKDLCVLTNKLASVLQELKVGFEDRVLLVLQDSPEWLAGWFATMKIGGVATHAYTYLQPDDYKYFMNYVRPRVVIADHSTIERVRKGAKASKYPEATLVAGLDLPGLEAGEYSLHSMLESANPAPEVVSTSKDDIAHWNFSGGTTGKPKAIPHMHHDAMFGFESFRALVQYTENDVVLRVPKLFFHYSRDLGMNYALRAGASVALFPERSTAETVFKMIEKYKPTVLLNVPTMMRAMLQTPKEKRTDLSCLRLCLSSGEILSGDLYEEFTEVFGVEVLNVIGSAESYLGYFMDRPGQVVPGSSGRITPLVEAKIVDNEGKEVPKGETGVLWVRSDASGWCYHLAHEKSKNTFMGGDWINTHDLFSEDEKGYFWYQGRADDLIKVSGVYVSPLEIERCIALHRAVRECVVLGLQDADGLVKTKAFISLKEGFRGSSELEQEIKGFCKKKMAPYKMPRFIEFLDELPKTGQGKIDKRNLRERGL
jgi:benzoate-CoA ligase family protein